MLPTDNAKAKQREAWKIVAAAKSTFALEVAKACEVCGVREEALRWKRAKPWADVFHAHHYLGYDHPLDVWFVCPACHKRMRDAQVGENGHHTLDEVRQVVRAGSWQVETVAAK